MAKTVLIGFRVTEEVKAAVAKAAADEDRTVSQWISRIVTVALREKGRLPTA